jgi:peptidoglycan-associated lipoprotein
MNASLSRCLALFTLTVGLSACAPQSYLVLLESPDQRPGAVVVRTAQGGEARIDQTGAALALRTDGSPATPVTIEPERVQTDFAATMQAQPKRPQRFILYFETGGARLTAESLSKRVAILEAVRAYPAPDISVIGHTDTVGNATENEALGLKRAHFVADWLMASDIRATEVTITSHGEANLLVPTNDNVDEPRNRRVEVTVR